MMKSTILFLINALAVLVILVPAAQGATLITDVSASASSYLPDKTNPERENPIKVVNGAGLTYPEHTNNKLLPEGEPDYGSFWHTGTLDRYTHDGAWFLIDLKQDYQLDPDTTLKIWNYNSTDGGSWMTGLNRGMRAVEFSYLADDGGPVLSLGYSQIPGDVNSDGVVNVDDAAILAANWLADVGGDWRKGDINTDGVVNDLDATLLATNWQMVAGGASGGVNGVLPSGTFTNVNATIFDHTGTEVDVLTKATGLETYSEYDTVAFGTSVTARYIKMTVMGGTGVGNYGDANFTGLSEVQAFSSDTATVVPEPTIAVLLSSVFATLLLALYRR